MHEITKRLKSNISLNEPLIQLIDSVVTDYMKERAEWLLANSNHCSYDDLDRAIKKSDILPAFGLEEKTLEEKIKEFIDAKVKATSGFYEEVAKIARDHFANGGK